MATTVNISATLAQRIDARRRDGETRGARLETDMADYLGLLREGLAAARRTLTQEEAMLIVDVLNATYPSPGMWLGGSLEHQVSDGIHLDGLDEKWGVDKAALPAKLRALGDLPCIALVDWAAGLWAKGDFDLRVETANFKGSPAK